MSVRKPTDDQVLAAIRERGPGGTMTYVLRNVLMKRTDDAAFVRRACQRLEKQGLIERVSSPFAIMICWAPKFPATPSSSEAEHG